MEQHTVRGVFKALRVPIHNDLLRSLLKASVYPAFVLSVLVIRTAVDQQAN